MAARLMGIADKTTHKILCDEATVQAASGRFTFQSLPPVQVKGKEQRVPVYTPLENQMPLQKSKCLHKSARKIVGRREEIAQFKAKLDRFLEKKENQTFFVEADPGLGKSMILKTFKEIMVGTKKIIVLDSAADAMET